MPYPVPPAIRSCRAATVHGKLVEWSGEVHPHLLLVRLRRGFPGWSSPLESIKKTLQPLHRNKKNPPLGPHITRPRRIVTSSLADVMLTPHGRGHGLAHPMVDHGKSPTNPLKSAMVISISTVYQPSNHHLYPTHGKHWKTTYQPSICIHPLGPTPQTLHREGHLKANQQDLPRGAAQQAQQEGGSKEPQPTKHGDD